MKIGIDARLLSRPLTGIGRYTLEMCRAMTRQGQVSLQLYSPAPLLYPVGTLTEGQIRTHCWEESILRQLWGETLLPFWAAKDNLDVFWGPAHRLPHFLPKHLFQVVTIHDLVWKHLPETMRPATRWLERCHTPSTLKRANLILTISQATALDLGKEFPSIRRKVRVIFPGVTSLPSSKDFAALAPLGITRPYFLFVGTLEPRKNLPRLLEAYAALPETIKQMAMLVIAGGEGWGALNISDYVTRLHLTDHVRLTGYVDDSMLATLYAHAHFLAMPSLYEGFGFPLVEAMSLGIPVLTSTISSMPEVAGEAGLLVNPMERESIEQGLLDFITNDTLRKSFALHTIPQAQKFNWDVSATQLIALFQKSIGSPGLPKDPPLSF